MPQQICFECLYRCEQWSNFKTMCHSVNQQLLKEKAKAAKGPAEDRSLLKVVKIEKMEQSLVNSRVEDPNMYSTTYTISNSDEEDDLEEDVSMDVSTEKPQRGSGTATACPLCKEMCKDMCDHLMMVHVSPGKMKCPICYKRYGLRHHLKMHIMSHTNQRPFRCTMCPMEFAHKTWMRNHMARTHFQNIASLDPSLLFGAHKCPLCDYTEAVPHLRNHFVVHTTERPYSCAYCDKDYTQVSNCKRHIRKEHQGKSVEQGIVIKEGSIFKNPHPWEELGYFLSNRN